MHLDILRELDTDGFECTDSDIQEGNPPLLPLPPYRFPTPLVIKFLYFSKQWFKEKFNYFYIILQIILQTTITWVISLKKLLAYKRRVGIIRKLPKTSYTQNVLFFLYKSGDEEGGGCTRAS